jgi:acyl dehydratase
MAESSLVTKEMKKAIGTWRMPQFAPEDVTIWAVLRYAAATEDPNPLWRDENYAKRTRWGGIITPPTSVQVYNSINRQFREQSGEAWPEVLPFPPPFESTFFASDEFEFLAPIRVGDAISSEAILGDVYEKQSRSGAGRLLFIQYNMAYHNQMGELLARQRCTLISAEASAPAVAKGGTDQSKSVTSATISPRQVCFEDVGMGFNIPSMTKHVTLTTMLKWAGATGDVGRPHFDLDYMTKVWRMPNVVAHGPLIGAYLAQLITNWIGGWGMLERHSSQYVGNVFPGAVVTFGGKVTHKYVLRGENFVDCETWAKDQGERIVALGKSTVTLPLRSQVC